MKTQLQIDQNVNQYTMSQRFIFEINAIHLKLVFINGSHFWGVLWFPQKNIKLNKCFQL